MAGVGRTVPSRALLVREMAVSISWCSKMDLARLMVLCWSTGHDLVLGLINRLLVH